MLIGVVGHASSVRTIGQCPNKGIDYYDEKEYEGSGRREVVIEESFARTLVNAKCMWYHKENTSMIARQSSSDKPAYNDKS
jgi:hypothetical protein